MSCGTFWPFISGRNTGFWNTRSSGTMPALQDLALAVDVAEVEVERLDALLEAACAAGPIPLAARMRGMTSNGISRSWRLGLAIDREGDADAAEQQFGLAAPVVEHVRADLAEPRGQLGIGRADLPVGPVHLIESNAQPAAPPPAGPSSRSPGGRSNVHCVQASRQSRAGVKRPFGRNFARGCLIYGQAAAGKQSSGVMPGRRRPTRHPERTLEQSDSGFAPRRAPDDAVKTLDSSARRQSPPEPLQHSATSIASSPGTRMRLNIISGGRAAWSRRCPSWRRRRRGSTDRAWSPGCPAR